MRYLYYLMLACCITGCKNLSHQNPPTQPKFTDSAQLSRQDTNAKHAVNDTSHAAVSPLKGSITVSGSFILFLRPDSARFGSDEQAESTGLYEGDADFGFGIAATEDSLKHNGLFRNIKLLVVTERYIKIEDCNTCPLTIDRDTVNYGYILSGKGMPPQKKYNSVHSLGYVGEIREYFKIKN